MYMYMLPGPPHQCNILPPPPHTHTGLSSAMYAQAQGASKATLDMFSDAQTTAPAMNYGMVQSAATSSEFVSRCLVKQKKKFAKIS